MDAGWGGGRYHFQEEPQWLIFGLLDISIRANGLVSSQVFRSYSQGNRCDPVMTGNCCSWELWHTKRLGHLYEGGKGGGSDEQRAELWLTLAALGCFLGLGRKWIPYFLNKMNFFWRCHMSSLSGTASSESRRFSGKALQWPLDASTRNTCQSRTSGHPNVSPAVLPCGRMACSWIPGIWVGSGINITSKQR